jgi:hypothetical protein
MMRMMWWMTRLMLFAAGMMTAPVLAQDAVGLTSEEQSRDSASAEIVDHSEPQQPGRHHRQSIE